MLKIPALLNVCIALLQELLQCTLKCISIGTPKTINFPFVQNGKLTVLGVPIFEHLIIRLLCAQILGHLQIINFTFRTIFNFIIFGCPNTYALYNKPKYVSLPEYHDPYEYEYFSKCTYYAVTHVSHTNQVK